MFDELKQKNIHINLSEKAKEFLLEKGYDPIYGARQIKRTLRKYIEDPMAEELLRKKITEGKSILVRVKGEELEFVEIEKGKPVEKRRFDAEEVKPHDSN
jgi:ATP-dependent Clp protease ATP-binding subunit ClpC